MLGLALAAALGPTFEWSAPEGCPAQARVLDQARTWGGEREPEDSARPIAIRGAIVALAAGFELDIEIRSASGTSRKTARAQDCEVLGNVAALMIAVAIDPLDVTRRLELAPELGPLELPPAPPAVVAPRVEPDDAIVIDAEPLVEPTRAQPPGLGGLARVSGSIGRGIVPALDGAIGVGVGVLTARVRADLEVFHVLSQDALAPPPSLAGASVAAWGAGLRVGPRFDLGPLELHLLAGVTAAALPAVAFGIPNPRPGTEAWVALSVVPGLRWAPIPRLAVGADLQADAALRRPAFALDGQSTLYRSPPLALRGSLVVELRWGPLVSSSRSNGSS